MSLQDQMEPDESGSNQEETTMTCQNVIDKMWTELGSRM